MKLKRKTIGTLFIGILLGITLVFGGAYAWYSFVIRPSNEASEVIAATEGAAENIEDEVYDDEINLENGEYHYYPAEDDTNEVVDIIYVSNLQEFLDALGNDRIIYIEEDINITEQIASIAPLSEYKIKDCEENEIYRSYFEDAAYQYLAYEKEYYSLRTFGYSSKKINAMDKSGFSNANKETNISTYDIFLNIKDTKNLTIAGNHHHIIIENKNSGVLDFTTNKHLTMSQLQMYHDVPVAGCGEFAPVVSFNDCYNVRIDKCQLNGSGTVGVYAILCDYLEVTNTKIYNCSEYAFDFSDIRNSLIAHCEIIDNRFDSFLSIGSSNVHIKNSRIENNHLVYNFLHFSNSQWEMESNIHFENCRIDKQNMEKLPDTKYYATITGLETSNQDDGFDYYNEYGDDEATEDTTTENLPTDVAEKFKGLWLNTKFETLFKETFLLTTAKNGIERPRLISCTRERFQYLENEEFYFLYWEDDELMYEDGIELGRLKKIDENTIQLLNDDDEIITTYRKMKNEKGEDETDFATGLNNLTASVLAGRYKLKIDGEKTERFTLKSDESIANSNKYTKMSMVLFQEEQVWRNVIELSQKDKTVQYYTVLDKEEDVLKLQKIDIVGSNKFNRENEFAELKRLGQ